MPLPLLCMALIVFMLQLLAGKIATLRRRRREE